MFNNLIIKLDRDQKEKETLLYGGQELTLNAIKSGKFLLKTSQGKGLKILITK